MPLITDTGFAVNSWLSVEADAEAPTTGALVFPLARLTEALATSAQVFGVHVPNTTRPKELAPFFSRLALISIAFPAFSDGRGFSLARALRNAGFKGELRASGPLIADQYAHAKACGFDSVEVPEALGQRQPEGQWKAAAKSLSLSYQRGYAGGTNILDQRRKQHNAEYAARIA